MVHTFFSIRRAAQLAALALGVVWLTGSAFAASAKVDEPAGRQEHTVAGCKLSHLRVATNDAATATITLDYRYEGQGKPPVRLVTLIEKKGDRMATNRFRAEDAEVTVGRGSVSIKVQYLKDEEPITTDRIQIQFIHPISKYLLGAATFDQPIAWGKQAADTASNGASEGVPKAVIQPVANAEVSREPAALTAGSFSALSSVKRAPWQEKLTLGAGDVLHFALFGEPDLNVQDVFIGPDGRVSYLEAQGVMAAGLTIDELRKKFDEELGKYRRSPRTIIMPATYQSKKYFILGRVSQKGVFTMDRPVSVIEAIARARGFETGMAERNLVELADLSHSFIARGGQRVSVDFEKLFLEGDLSQNIPLEPNDYLYFPASDTREFYVLGEVKYPGAVTYSSGAATVGAIAQRGGFTEKAWKGKVLVVRGSLSHPETFVVNMPDILAARTPDFKLEPKDIVYVSGRPWVKAEELLDALATSFVQAAVITWTGGNIGSIIK